MSCDRYLHFVIIWLFYYAPDTGREYMYIIYVLLSLDNVYIERRIAVGHISQALALPQGRLRRVELS